MPIMPTMKVLILEPTYAEYANGLGNRSRVVERLVAIESKAFQPDLDKIHETAGDFDTVFICNPNNPTGVLLTHGKLLHFCRQHPDVRFIIDESYLPFVPQGHLYSMAAAGLPNVIVLQSFSKIFRLPGLRLGYMIAPKRMIEAARRTMPPWSMNSLIEPAMGYFAGHQQNIQRFIAESRSEIQKEKIRFQESIDAIPGLSCFASVTSFVLIRLPASIDAQRTCDGLAQRRILIRNCANFFGLGDQFIRISIKESEANTRVANLLSKVVNATRCKPGPAISVIQ